MYHPDPNIDYTTTFAWWWEQYAHDSATMEPKYPIGGETWMAAKAAWDYAVISSISVIQKQMR